MNIRYLDHSGFAVTLQNRLFVFDYANLNPADGGWEEGIIPKNSLKTFDAVYFFVSHSHGDHFTPAIYSLSQSNPHMHYFISSDVRQERSVPYTVLTAGKCYHDQFLSVRACGSTDIGVSYLVEAAGKKIFHAGDLNCWHWHDDCSAEEEQDARAHYDAEISRIAPYAAEMHTAFLPVDPRMKGSYEDGARIFAEKFHPKHIVPMHLWGNFSVAEQFRNNMENFDTFVYHRRGETITYHD